MGSISPVSLVRPLILREEIFRGESWGGDIYPSEFFLSYNCNETENNLNGSIRKDTGHLSGFLSRAMVNSRNVKMMCVWGDWGQSPSVFFSHIYQVYFLWVPLHFNSNEFSSFMFETYLIWIWWKIKEKRGVVLQA